MELLYLHAFLSLALPFSLPTVLARIETVFTSPSASSPAHSSMSTTAVVGGDNGVNSSSNDVFSI
ncbi:hypothetical protein PIB30_108139, partial [Stylosanthes scabra]|nr:hypothetical protein [Stylosanthes scabra]